MSQDIYPVTRFYVSIDGVTKAVFTELSGLQLETDVFEYAEGGNNGFVHRLPGSTKVGNLTLKRGVAPSNELFQWYLKTARGEADRRHLTVSMYDTAGNELMRWDFLRAYPIKWVGPQLTSNGSNSAIETLELAHDGMQIDEGAKGPIHAQPTGKR